MVKNVVRSVVGDVQDARKLLKKLKLPSVLYINPDAVQLITVMGDFVDIFLSSYIVELECRDSGDGAEKECALLRIKQAQYIFDDPSDDVDNSFEHDREEF